ncbi:tRNA nucleotidyltransferase [Geomicrobium sp. JCM 19039]|nr:CCA tRNA nucleotidyltransferase [Geomicrobium sp. JCM 19039]GAK11848.1 tRNA nucleotidyltransferase [Geomicrobium sp. JCM 19039]
MDPFQGIEDIKKQQLRPLHNLSFMEDPTRILRAIRFEQRFGFTLTIESRRFIKEAESSIQELTVNRIRNEWQKMIAEGLVTEAYARLEELNVLQSFFPGARYNDRTTEVLGCSMPSDQDILSTIFPLYTTTLPDLKRFAVTKYEQQLVQELSTLFDLRLGENTTCGDLHRSVKQISNHALRLTACTKTGHKHSLLNQYVQKRKNLPVLIQADDLLVRGFKKGPIIKHTLQTIEELWFDDQIATREQALDYINSLRNL